MSTMLQQLNFEMASVVEEAEHGLVQVCDSRGSGGAGTIWHPDGLVVTNAHVVRHGPITVTTQDGRTFPGHVLARDPARDLAALAVDATGLTSMEPGSSRGLRPGQWVIALGHPWGAPGSATAGVLIGTGPEGPDNGVPGQDWLVVSLHLRPGYSGGPLIDTQGRLVGINTMMTGPDVGVAVPVHVAKAFLHEKLTAGTL